MIKLGWKDTQKQSYSIYLNFIMKIKTSFLPNIFCALGLCNSRLVLSIESSWNMSCWQPGKWWLVLNMFSELFVMLRLRRCVGNLISSRRLSVKTVLSSAHRNKKWVAPLAVLGIVTTQLYYYQDVPTRRKVKSALQGVTRYIRYADWLCIYNFSFVSYITYWCL